MKILSLLLTLLFLEPMASAQDNNNTLDSQFANPTSLTDEQMKKANEFVHEGQRTNYVKKECEKAGKACKEPNQGMQVEDMIRMAYATMGGAIKLTKKPNLVKTEGLEGPKLDEAKAANAEAVKNKEETTDYCGLVATGWEAVSMMMQNSMQSKAENASAQETDIQMKSLVNLRETHRARQKTASIQGWVYTGVTACYGAMLAKGGVAADWKLIAKMGGAGALATLYHVKASKHGKAAKKVQDIIASLDKDNVGKNCNPWTGTACFCAELTSQKLYPAEYQEVCILNKGDPDGVKFQASCVTVNAQKKYALDEKCDCKKTNSCARSPLTAFGGSMGVGNNLMNEANKTFDLLGQGEFDRAQMEKAALSMNALASRMKIPDGVVPMVSLTPDQKKMAEELSSVMNPAIAGVASTLKPANVAGLGSGTGPAGLSKGEGPKEKESSGNGVNVNYKQGGSNSFAATDSVPEFTMPGMAQPEAQNGTEVVSFAEEALSKADVSNAPSTPIFDIISNRYRISGWKTLDTEGK